MIKTSDARKRQSKRALIMKRFGSNMLLLLTTRKTKYAIAVDQKRLNLYKAGPKREKES